MRNKIVITIFVTILVLQPLIALVGVGAGFTPIEMSSGFTSTQEPGSRLGSGEYTNHVPIIIDETSDFVYQGWPGSGTEINPYTIAGLRIVADLDLVCISIRNTTAHFLIQDCYIEQGSDMAAIHFLNTTHGTIQYTTVNSTGGTSIEMGAIYLYNANNTRVDHVAVYANEHMAYLAQYSTSLVSEFSYFESTNYRAMKVDDGEYCTIDGCEFYNWNFYCVVNQRTNYTTVTDSLIYSDTATSGLAIYDCDFTTVTNVYIWAPGDSQGALNIDDCNHVDISSVTVDSCTTGVDILTCTDVSIQDSSVSDAGSDGIVMSNVPFVTLLRCDVTGTIGNGIDITNAPNATIRECTTTDVFGRGLRMSSSDNSTIQLCSFTDVGDHGLYVTTSSDLLVEDITISESSNMGAFFDSCDRPVLSNLDISYTMDTALEFSDSPNGSIVDTNIMYSDSNGLYSDNGCDYWFFSNLNIQNTDSIGFYLRDAVECDIVNNYIRNTGDNGFRLDMVENLTLTNNQIFDCESDGISISEAWLAYIADNHIQDCDYGFSMDASNNVTITNLDIIDVVYVGMNLYDMAYPTISHIEISSGYRGIEMGYVYLGVFDDIAIEGSGIHMNAGSIPLIYFDHTFTDVTVNGLDVYYGKHLEDVSISGGPYGQIILVNCTNFNVTGGSFDYCSTAVHVLFSEQIQLRDMSSSHNTYGAYVIYSDNVSIINFDVYGKLNAMNIYASYSDDFEIIDSTLTRATGEGGHGIYLNYCTVVDIISCDISYSGKGIYAYWTGNVTMVDLDISHMESYAVHVWGDTCDYLILEDSAIYNASRGLYSDRGQNWTVRGNTISHCVYTALEFAHESGDFGLVELNTLESNRDGIIISSADEYTVRNNTIRWNSRYGIYITGSTNTEVMYNIIAFSGTDDGYDDRSGNYWDDGVSLGNSWSDFTPPAPYAVDGNTDDRYPLEYAPTTPIVDHPMDIWYAEFSTGNEIIWQPKDDSLGSWTVNIDGAFWVSDAWDFSGTVVVNVDDLSYGVHILDIIIYDVDMNSVADTVYIHVFDGTDPTINGPANTLAFVDGTGQSLTWAVSDLHPGQYKVLVDDAVTASGTWVTGTLTASIDGLTAGIRVVQMWIYDLDSNFAMDTVLVEVIDDNAIPIIDHPDDLEIVEGTTGNKIVWSPTDDYPESFIVTYNGSAFVSASWGGSRITVSVDGLSPGIHSFSVTVYDGSGNSASDQVDVTVIASVVTTILPPIDVGLLLIVGAVAGAIVVVVIVIYILKKRS